MVDFIRCPTCRALFDPAKTPAMPFCSERCQMIDLGRWLREDYGLPVEPEREEADGPESPWDESGWDEGDWDQGDWDQGGWDERA